MEDNVLTPYLLVNGKHIKGLLTENRERYLRKQEFEFGWNEIGMDKFNLDIEIVKMTIKSIKSNTSCGVGGVTAELLNQELRGYMSY